jgi:hypothetical protein
VYTGRENTAFFDETHGIWHKVCLGRARNADASCVYIALNPNGNRHGYRMWHYPCQGRVASPVVIYLEATLILKSENREQWADWTGSARRARGFRANASHQQEARETRLSLSRSGLRLPFGSASPGCVRASEAVRFPLPPNSPRCARAIIFPCENLTRSVPGSRNAPFACLRLSGIDTRLF